MRGDDVIVTLAIEQPAFGQSALLSVSAAGVRWWLRHDLDTM
jgi:hypothetical protein